MSAQRQGSSSSTKPTKAGQDELFINKQFAEHYDETQRRQILRDTPASVLNDQGSASESSSSEEEDEYGELLTKGIDRGVREALSAIRNKDPRIYDDKVSFFEKTSDKPSGEAGSEDDKDQSDSDADANSDDEPVAGWDTIANAAQRDVPKMTLKDYVRENLLTRGTLAESDESDGDGEEKERPDYDHERDEVARASKKLSLKTSGKKKAAILQEGDDAENSDGSNSDNDNDGEGEGDEGDGDGDGEELFMKKDKTQTEIEEEEKDFERFLVKTAKKRNKAAGDDLLLHSYLENETPDEKERFLRDFILNNGWLDKNTGDAPAAGDYAIEVDLPEAAADHDDDAFLDKVDEFEADVNFRFEDPNAEKIVFHARHIPGSMRRPDDRRKRAREARSERKIQEKAVKTEEIKQLKNIKKREIQSRLLAIKEAAGDDIDLAGIDLEGDFDPEKFNQQMDQRFGDDYYANNDDGMKVVTEEGVASASEKRFEGKETEDAPEDVRADVNKMMDEYYNLDYEDIVGGTPMRFNYKQVEPESFNLTSEDILGMDDKELNRMVSLKYLAPYRANRDIQKQAWRVKNAMRKNMREPEGYENSWKSKSKGGSKERRNSEIQNDDDDDDKPIVKASKKKVNKEPVEEGVEDIERSPKPKKSKKQKNVDEEDVTSSKSSKKKKSNEDVDDNKEKAKGKKRKNQLKIHDDGVEADSGDHKDEPGENGVAHGADEIKVSNGKKPSSDKKRKKRRKEKALASAE